jgi:Apea-like HEPN
LVPDEHIQKALFSTTSQLADRYKTNDILVAEAWAGLHDRSATLRTSEGPISRNAYVVAFRTPPYTGAGAGVIIPDYSHVADSFCNYLSVLFGKRFDSHGLLEGSGFFRLVNLTSMNVVCTPTLPHNSYKPRADFSTDLSLRQLVRMKSLLASASLDRRFLQHFRTASKFYAQALRGWEHDAEAAYLDLVTAGEVLSNFFKYGKDALLDEDAKEMIDLIRKHVPHGEEVAGRFASRLRGIRKKFVRTVLDLVTPDFFTRTESTSGNGKFDLCTFERAIGAAYDLRSRHLHTGAPFGFWVSRLTSGGNEEVQTGLPAVKDPDLAKALARAPTLVGLERVIRFCLLRFAEQNGAYDSRELLLDRM